LEIESIFGIGKEREIANHMKILDNFCSTIIKSRKSENTKDKDDLLSRCINIQQETNEELSDKETRDFLLNILLAGRDTTAITLSWNILMLIQNPEKAAILYSEIQDRINGELNFDIINDMPYLDAFVKENLRLNPSVPWDGKEATRDITLPSGAFIPKGTRVRYYIYAMGRNKKIWGEDAAEFKPERWLDGKHPSDYSYIVFNAGPRLCLGKKFALLETKVVLVNVLRQFKFELIRKPNVMRNLTMPMDSLQVRLKKN